MPSLRPALAASDVPVPVMHALCEDESVIGRVFYVMDFVDGRVLWDQALPGMGPDVRRAHYDEMNPVIAALHAVDASAVGLDGFGRAEGYFARQSPGGRASTAPARPTRSLRWRR